jgi:hypothetical protein
MAHETKGAPICCRNHANDSLYQDGVASSSRTGLFRP